ncbi:polysaccharide deacetylase family protein [Nocardiopsis gilva]|uniref:polysaccharide deacetylase family protein n=1 Tax=Nocardiopsis gilva TaxID=280236 RepID=UPI001E3CAEE5|nr:polysaccharide deacetylase family protein [Nocardiopsis gilva]
MQTEPGEPDAPFTTPNSPAPTSAGRRTPRLPRASAPIALALVTALALAACSSPDAEHKSDKPERAKATGKADELTVVDLDNVPDVTEETKETEESGVTAELAYPKIPNADPLTKRLGEITGQERDDFLGANSKAKDIKIGWNLSVAGDDVVAVRLTQDEKDDEGEHTAYATYWYDTTTGTTAYSTELLAGQKELETLDGLVKKALKDKDAADTSQLYPILRSYDSMGFNPDGDLVVEFDEGQVAPVKSGRISAVIPKEDVDPLLSDFGKKAQAAAVVVTPDYRIEKAATPPKDGADAEIPGMMPVRDDSVDCSDPASKCIALTFDDGPGERTPELLDALAEYDAKATFFLTGEPVQEHASTVRREYAEGHELANHTVHHPDLTRQAEVRVRAELDTVNDLVRRETGFSLELMRPPYGATNDMVSKISKEKGLAEIIWSVDTNDWKDRNASIVSKRAVQGAQPGSIILMHDIHGTTIDAVPSILKQLDEKGYKMVTVSQLLGDTEPGKSYFNGHPEEKKDGADSKEDKEDKGEKDGKDEKGTESPASDASDSKD